MDLARAYYETKLNWDLYRYDARITYRKHRR